MVSLVVLCVSPVAHAGEPVGTDPVAAQQRGGSGLGCHAQPCVPDEVVETLKQSLRDRLVLVVRDQNDDETDTTNNTRRYQTLVVVSKKD